MWYKNVKNDSFLIIFWHSNFLGFRSIIFFCEFKVLKRRKILKTYALARTLLGGKAGRGAKRAAVTVNACEGLAPRASTNEGTTVGRREQRREAGTAVSAWGAAYRCRTGRGFGACKARRCMTRGGI